jgi:response regulator NasT
MQSYVLAPESAPPAPESRHEKNVREDRSPILEGKRVVVVEDEGVTQMQLRRLLKHAGLNVVASAASGEEGVAAVLNARPDLVMMDICMPGAFDGLEAARRILAEYNVCIVMLTAFSEDEFRKRAAELNVCGYVLKPITTESLLPQIETALRNFKRA